MKIRSLRSRVAFWSVGVVTAALLLFGAGVAWNLRNELREHLDEEIKNEAVEFFAKLKQQGVNWNDARSIEALFDEAKRSYYAEIHDAGGRLLYRSANLQNQQVFSAGRGRALQEVAWNGRTLRYGVFEENGIVLALGKDDEEASETIGQLMLAYLLALPLVAIVVGVGSWWVAHRAVAPVKSIAGQAEKISASDLHQRLPQSSSEDEIGDLAQVLNDMFDRLQRSFDQVTRFTSDASHELKTPLALVQAEVESALRSPLSASEQRELLSNVTEQCSQLSQIVDGLLLLSRADDRRLILEQGEVDLVRLIRELMEDAEILAESNSLYLECELPAELVVIGDRRLLARALMNLIDNAIKYNRHRGDVVVSAKIEGEEAVIIVRNSGKGIPPRANGKIFERFYRGDISHSQETAGHGLGLSIAREIARLHGGDILLLQSDAQWTKFSLRLPDCSVPARAKTTQSNQQTAP